MTQLSKDVLTYLEACDKNNEPASLIFKIDWSDNLGNWSDARALEQWFANFIGQTEDNMLKVLSMALNATFVVETTASYFKDLLAGKDIECFRSIEINNSTDTTKM